MSSLYYKNQKYTGPTLDLGSGSLTTDNKTIVGAINELDAEVGGLIESGGEQYNRYCQIGNLLICYGRISETLAASATVEKTITFPKSFSASEAPSVSVTPITASDYDLDLVYLKSRSSYSCVVTLKNGYSGANTIIASWIAIGIRE